eukprot:CAMPEP_0178439164 /NCGR_PEP_ID=MMETSP0689_2-20121128/36004_1 /TAXON_ID=160604 /ORGANISM="Amphidinium massartii, Strain CS-259" /LENGTH=44 /DNA_ID= /DNA_START= /DNA_END= /DNA_ORIENTATION=
MWLDSATFVPLVAAAAAAAASPSQLAWRSLPSSPKASLQCVSCP